MEPILDIRDLETRFLTDAGVVRAVDGVSLALGKGEILGLVGESGCGKSVTALSILRLVPHPPGRIAAGSVLFEGRDLLRLPEGELRGIRGNRISMIFQEPMTSLNPVFTVGDQIAEVYRVHRGMGRTAAAGKAVEMLRSVGIPDPERRAGEYPHQMSGGMLQRVMIAMALACRPALLIADEPTTALDVTIQAGILDLIRGLRKSLDMSVLLITHDLGVVAETADRVAVMYAGKIVEEADTVRLFGDPRHPYTRCLFRAIPRIGKGGRRLRAIRGSVPEASEWPPGCRFHPRCPLTREKAEGGAERAETVEVRDGGSSFRVLRRCAGEIPPLEPAGEGGRLAACWFS